MRQEIRELVLRLAREPAVGISTDCRRTEGLGVAMSAPTVRGGFGLLVSARPVSAGDDVARIRRGPIFFTAPLPRRRRNLLRYRPNAAGELARDRGRHFRFGLPRATRRRKRVVSRSWAFQAMSHTTLGSAS